MADFERIKARAENVKMMSSTQFNCTCPAHKDKNPSLTVSLASNGRILTHCHAGCSFDEIVSAWGLSKRDFAPAPDGKPPKQKKRIVAVYKYPHAEKIRYEPKSFAWRHLGEDGTFIYNRRGIPHELYIREIGRAHV